MSGLVDLSDPAAALVAAKRPALANAVARHYSDLVAIAGEELVELCRVRVKAVLFGAETDPIQEGETDVQSACLSFTDQFIVSAQWISDEHVGRLRRHLAPDQVFALVVATSLAERWYRLTGLLAGTIGQP